MTIDLFILLFFIFFILHCFICYPSGFNKSENARIEPRTVAMSALQSDALSPWLDLKHVQLNLIHTQLDLIHTRPAHPHSARSHLYFDRSHPHLAISHTLSSRIYSHSARSHPHLTRPHPIILSNEKCNTLSLIFLRLRAEHSTQVSISSKSFMMGITDSIVE
jgi:hypothetical protein